MSSGNAATLRRRVLLSGTMLVAAAAGYGRRAYGACAPTGAPNYQCSGANAATQPITAVNNASVSTVAGFSVNTAAGNAITITGDGALSYTDTNASPLTTTAATGYALFVRSGGAYAGTPGSVTITTNGALSGFSGIDARNYGTGAVTVTANGNVTTTSRGIFAQNLVRHRCQRDHRRRRHGERLLRHCCEQLRHGRGDHHGQRQCHRRQRW